ncbi:Putative agmatine deiminase [Roseovarius albus]|uniref:Putative agmatine deiminase n=1 Tax=Roseovarius albus TaxID=1247867 RepID=A0A1X7A4G1_9RHOB|nr:agmatine deiminase family protein [Roseovarius albus]SLN69812.1 Putative agmatine deiminase [Roseovarius albus]
MTIDIKAELSAGKTPGELGFVMPAETARHAACWMAWVHDDHADTWGAELPQVQGAFVEIATAISQFERVRVVAHPEVFDEARKLLPPQVDVIALAQDDLWFRDTGPLFVQNEAGQTIGSNLIFNNWGDKFPIEPGDRDIGANLINHLDLPLFQSPLCGEGGGLISDGRGTVITTETCFLNPNRNAGMTKADVERELFHAIGARKVIWLPGDTEEWITDGHIDGVLTFVKPGHVIFEDNPDDNHPHQKVCRENLKALKGQTDADGNEIEITLMNEAYLYDDGSDASATSYVNCYIANGGIVLPKFGTPETDEAAVDVFRQVFPERKIVQVDIRNVCWNGGGIHCMTQQQPA